LLRALVGGGYVPSHAMLVVGTQAPTMRGTVRPVHQQAAALALAALGGRATAAALAAYVQANAAALAHTMRGNVPSPAHATAANVAQATAPGNLRCTWANGVVALAPLA